jgi:hypothetical protein
METEQDPGASLDSSEPQQSQAAAVEREAPRSGAPAGGGPPSFLDKEGRNLPRDTVRPLWSKKQWTTRRAVIDRLRYWQGNGYQCLWVTLTSAPDSPEKRLREDFQVLRKRMDRELGFSKVEYVCVDTREGHGVLHMIWAWRDTNPRKKASFYVPFEWLQEQWKRIHGAFHVNVKRIGGADKDARRLSRYIVAQYCGDQNALVRLSQSRMAIPLTRMREQLLRLLRGLPERYELGGELAQSFSGDEFTKVFSQFLWAGFRKAWAELLRVRSCQAFGVQFVWINGQVQRI